MGVSQRAFCHTVLYSTILHRKAFAFSNKDMTSKCCFMNICTRIAWLLSVVVDSSSDGFIYLLVNSNRVLTIKLSEMFK